MLFFVDVASAHVLSGTVCLLFLHKKIPRIVMEITRLYVRKTLILFGNFSNKICSVSHVELVVAEN